MSILNVSARPEIALKRMQFNSCQEPAWFSTTIAVSAAICGTTGSTRTLGFACSGRKSSRATNRSRSAAISRSLPGGKEPVEEEPGGKGKSSGLVSRTARSRSRYSVMRSGPGVAPTRRIRGNSISCDSSTGRLASTRSVCVRVALSFSKTTSVSRSSDQRKSRSAPSS
jgi:hypothetical protein